jgi:hypothetical protein
MPSRNGFEEEQKKYEDQNEKERPVPSLKALEQLGGEEYDFFIELPRRDVWEVELNLEDW